MKIVNLFAGPGTGKSITAAALYAELKYCGVNCEYIQEYAKDATWEQRGPKVFRAQEYLFGKQHFRVSRVISEVDLVVTDNPVVMGLVYVPDGFALPSLKNVMLEAHHLYDSLNIFIERAQHIEYQTSGRNQNIHESKEIDEKILKMLDDEHIQYHKLKMSRNTPFEIIDLMGHRGWKTC